MAQGVFDFQYEEEQGEAGLSALAGLPTYLDLAKVMGLAESVSRHIEVDPIDWTGEGVP